MQAYLAQPPPVGCAPISLGTTDPAARKVREALQQRVDTLGGQISSIQQRLGERDALVEREQALDQARGALQEQLDTLLATLRGDGEGQPVAGWASGEVSRLERELAALDEARVRAAEQSTNQAKGAADATRARLDRDVAILAGQTKTLAADLGRPLSADLAGAGLIAEVNSALPALAGQLPSRPEVETALSGLDQRRGALERALADAQATLGEETSLSLEDATAALTSLEEELNARRRGQEIVGATRQRMINKVLPDTIDNMCLLLPMLTAERYRYAELTTDYRLQVWDERKRGFVEKNLFSGGTQDQFSLALRLGFALAALPRELGTSPGFLFLDEPLSSFDRDRTEALVSMLTHGQIATFFQQVFLISHSQGFEPGLFTHHIVMEHGEVAESTLPIELAP